MRQILGDCAVTSPPRGLDGATARRAALHATIGGKHHELVKLLRRGHSEIVRLLLNHPDLNSFEKRDS